MITYHNAGVAGRGYSSLLVSDYGDGAVGIIAQDKTGDVVNIVLDATQVRHLAAKLTAHVGGPLDPEPMIEGDNL